MVGGIALIAIIISSILAVLLHEGAHAICARLLGMSLIYVRPTAVGMKARLRGNFKSFKKMTLFYLSGPAGNFLIAAVLWRYDGELGALCDANLAIGVFNLLPMYPLDGGQIALIVLYKLMGSSGAFVLIKRVTIVVRILMYAGGLLQLIILRNPSLLAAALVLPGTRLLEEKVGMMKLENLINRKQRIISKGVYPVRHVVVMDSCTLGDALQRMDYDRFHILYVLNSNMEIVGQITEQQVIKALQTCNASDKMCDVFFFGL